MNRRKKPGPISQLAYRLMLFQRRFAATPKCRSFGKTSDQFFRTIGEIYVINLDRQVQRWSQMERELRLINDHKNIPLIEMTKRFSAIDAKYHTDIPNRLELRASYTLEDQLFVEPQPSLAAAQFDRGQRIDMSRQEIAVALSHIAIWKMIANGKHPYVLVVEDDVYFSRDFAAVIDQAWADLLYTTGQSRKVDLVYLSYEEAKGKADKEHVSEYLFRPRRGLWNLSGYVLSKKGANRLLNLLPVCGPVDLWINHQFDKLDVFATSNSVIEQRRDYRSDNSYSILPVLSKLGVLSQEGPSIFERRPLTTPIFAMGRPGTGLTSLAMALSMLGYRCCSDISALPKSEHEYLFRRKRFRVFDAYVNVGSLEARFIELAKLYRNARIILTADDEEQLNGTYQCPSNEERSAELSSINEREGLPATAVLIRELRKHSVKFVILPVTEQNKWRVLGEFLECDPPASAYPIFPDRPQRCLSIHNSKIGWRERGLKKLKFDKSPWIAAPSRHWNGIAIDEASHNPPGVNTTENLSERFSNFDCSDWKLLDDTFPGNLALFRRENFSIASGGSSAMLTVRKEGAYVRDYTSASLCSRKTYQYGRFQAVIKPAKVSGLITGMFLHRNSPRQEIDIEFLGIDTTKLLVNVYYNPGGDGAKFDYGYRGTPALIDLGFDAADDFHRYSIEWSSTSIRWFIDGRLLHERANWEPTPIPHLPMQLYINVWPSRSRELAGRLSDDDLPAHSEIRSMDFQVWPSP